MAPHRVVVVINHFGGVPGAMAHNIAGSQCAWSATEHTDVVLGRLRPEESLRAILAAEEEPRLGPPDGLEPGPTLLSAARDAGYYTVMLGAHGLGEGDERPPRRHAAERLPDPRAALRPIGIERCSCLDGALFPGRAEAHDEEVLHEARRLLAERDASSPPLLLWINLLSCRDLQRVRFRTPAPGGPAVDVCTARASLSLDRSALPRRLAASIPGVSARLARADARRHGEVEPGGLTRAREAEGEYARLLDLAWDLVQRQEVRIAAVVAEALRHDAAIAYTATHLLSLGEHGARGGDVPSAVCCASFWCCRPEAPRRDAATVEEHACNFLASACGFAAPGRRPPPLTLSRLPPAGDGDGAGEVLSRALVALHDHTYACLGLAEEAAAATSLGDATRLHAVYDLSTDADESADVLADVAHLHAELLARVRDMLPRRVRVPAAPARNARPPLTSASSAPARVPTARAPAAGAPAAGAPAARSRDASPVRELSPPSPAPSDRSAASSITSLTSAAALARRRAAAPATRRPTRPSVRASETRINTAHR